MPAYFPWTPELSIGIDEIDAQHKLLVDMINRIYIALVNQSPREEATQIFDELVQYTYVHFAVEECLFRITNYPDYDNHKALHDTLKQQVIETRDRFTRGEIGLDLKLMAFLRSWLEDHILGEDKHYATHLLDSGLKATWARSSWVGKIWNSFKS
jgi:hemerythrin